MQGSSGAPASAFFGRVLWLFFGPMFLVLLTFGIVRDWSGWVTGLDVAFFVIVGVMLLGRWLEFRGGRPETVTGEPATPAHLQRYLLLVPLIGLAVWVTANLLGRSWFG
jgi:hypothetical protein